jgi:hypothetical protein
MYGVADRRSHGVVLEERLGQAHDEQAFRYFLEIECGRAARAHRPVLLLLLDAREPPAIGADLDPVLAAKLFSGLWRCLRETDIVGWHREGRIPGAILTQVEDGLRPEATREIRQRVKRALCEVLSADVARRLRVRVHQLRPGLKG